MSRKSNKKRIDERNHIVHALCRRQSEADIKIDRVPSGKRPKLCFGYRHLHH